ncbi:MAG TPA: Maf family protein [Vicinamibacterales bacterium]
MSRLVLASASPRRAELLSAAGFDFTVRPSDVDESVRPGEAPEDYVRRLALEKARHVAAPGELVLGADTAVVVDGDLLGKPRSREEAAGMLRRLSGRAHEVLTGVALVAGDREAVDLSRTTVHVHPISEEEIAWYVATPEPYDKAGGYAVQGLASRFIARLDGSYSNVVGLPVDLVYRLMRTFGREGELEAAGAGRPPGPVI